METGLIKMTDNRPKIDPGVVDRTYRIIKLALELDEYWRKSTPSYELSDEDITKILGILAKIEELISQLKRELSSKP